MLLLVTLKGNKRHVLGAMHLKELLKNFMPVVYSEFVLKVSQISQWQTFYHDAGAWPINDQSMTEVFSA